jgi:hypothetical protein
MSINLMSAFFTNPLFSSLQTLNPPPPFDPPSGFSATLHLLKLMEKFNSKEPANNLAVLNCEEKKYFFQKE